MLRLSELSIVESQDALKDIPEGKVLINTINAHSLWLILLLAAESHYLGIETRLIDVV